LEDMTEPRTEEFRVRFNEADASAVATIQTIGNWLQEAADLHARDLGWARDQLRDRRLFWALVGLRIRMTRYPAWRELARVTTWPAGADRIYAWRDFVVADRVGRPLGAATSAWLLVNEDSRRPIRMPQAIHAMAVRDQPRALSHNFREKLAPPMNCEHEARFKVRRSDLDVNGHVNNVSFIDWAVESTPVEVAAAAQVEELLMEFHAEALLGAEVLAQSARQASEAGRVCVLHRLVNAQDGRVLALARTVWQSGPVI
jgi:acyl-ACP thioesterase